MVATTVEVNVTQTQEEVAEEQMHVEETQRVFGFVPNYYVTYIPDAAPLTTKQKFNLGWKSTVDPVVFGFSGVLAGLEQAKRQVQRLWSGRAGLRQAPGRNLHRHRVRNFYRKRDIALGFQTESPLLL